MSKVVVSIVAWNSMKYLPNALASVAEQSHGDLAVIVVDNGSSDGASDFVHEAHPTAVVLRNRRNLGFARAHDQAIEYARTHFAKDGEDVYVLVLNPDTLIGPHYAERLAEALDRRPEIAAATGKLLRVHDRFDGDMYEPEFTDVIDSAGLVVRKSRRAVDRGAGTANDEEFERTTEIFGVSGAAGMYRLAALEDVAYQGTYFDEDFFAYKEDVDLAWRLRLRGWSALFVPRAKAFHYRAVQGEERQSLLRTIRGRRGRSAFVSFLSYRNHALVLLKNEHFSNLLLHAPWILWYEFRKFLFVLFLEPRSLKAVPAALALVPRMLRKRKATFSRARASAKEIRKWFV